MDPNPAFGAKDMNVKQKGKLPRLQREFYLGAAVVFWTLTLEHRAQGWLDVSFHARFRELMLHAAARSHLLCSAYCLMPDHLHLSLDRIAPTE